MREIVFQFIDKKQKKIYLATGFEYLNPFLNKSELQYFFSKHKLKFKAKFILSKNEFQKRYKIIER